jgi:hypothetical protein
MPAPDLIAVVSAFVVGLVGTLVVCTVWAARSETVYLTLGGVGGVGVLCAVIGAATRSRPEALLAGAVGVAVATLLLGAGTYQAPILVFIWVVLELPYLVGFGVAALLVRLA